MAKQQKAKKYRISFEYYYETLKKWRKMTDTAYASTAVQAVRLFKRGRISPKNYRNIKAKLIR